MSGKWRQEVLEALWRLDSMQLLARQFSMFVIVGGISTAAHYLVLIVLVHGFDIGPVAASMMGYATGGVVNYRLNYSLTFASRRDHREAFWRFIAIALTGFALNGLIMSYGVNSLQLHYLFAQVAATLIVMVWNFTANRLWTFAK